MWDGIECDDNYNYDTFYDPAAGYEYEGGEDAHLDASYEDRYFYPEDEHHDGSYDYEEDEDEQV